MLVVQIIFFISIYIIGVLLGSFFTLATYRLPLKQDILYTRSYCPNCNHRLKIGDLIPILSYIFLGGKCRYCGQKISPRYIIIEFFSGLFYLLFVISLKIDILNISINNIIQILHGTLIISILFILGGIAKETKELSKGTMIFGLIMQTIYIIYLYVLHNNIYRYIIYITCIIILLILEKQIKDNKRKQLMDLLLIMLFSIIITNEIIFVISTVFTIILWFIMNYKIKPHKPNLIFYFSFSNIIFFILYNFLINYINIL